ncbi:MAG: aminopeptidase P family protein [Clostridia bacterium]|nr:aminopeptidase P family protein [Clostridia bacterium]
MNRCERLISAIGDKADGMLISSEVNRLYLTGFEFSDGYVLVTKNKSYLITDFRYIEAAKSNADNAFEIVTLENNLFEKLFDENKVCRLLFEDTRMSCSALEQLKNKHSNITFIPAGSIIENLREYKSDVEVEFITKAQRIAEKSLDMLISSLDMNMTEKELTAYLEYLMKKNGADGISFATIAVSGKASSLPHGVPRNQKLENGFLTIDFGAVYKGYHSDMTRTFCKGKADNDMKKVYNTVLEAQTRAIDSIFSGERNCFSIDNTAREHIYLNGFKGCFGHGLGHGVGLEIHEAPRLSPLADKNKYLDFGDIVTVEPGIYIENKYGVRIEDMIYIGIDGPKNLTLFEKNLIEL